jgi:endonuclease-3
LRNKIEQIIFLLSEEFPGHLPKHSKSDPLDVLIATMLSQNTTDKTSYIAFQNLKKRYKNWEEVLTSPIKKVRDAIRVCGLTNQKSKSIRTLLKGLKRKYDSMSLDFIKKLSNDEIYQELLKYDGVGIKTVSCVLAFGLGRDVFPVDTHVHRLANRLGLVRTKSPDKTFEQLQKIVPDGKKFLLHTMLIKFGRKICRAKNPLCGKCVLYDLCEFKDKEYYSSEKKGIPEENNFIILEHV